jgi:hypothetical protein
MNQPEHITLEEQLEVDQQLLDIQRDIDQLINKVYLMGYNKGLLHKQNTPYFP